MDAQLSKLVAEFDPRDEHTVARLAERLASDPPANANDVALAMRPFFRFREYKAEAAFPTLLAGLAQPNMAAAVLDLANCLLRRGQVRVHPAASRTAHLTGLLGGLVERLGRLEERPLESGEPAETIAARVNESVSLAVSLCDALALIGDRSATGKLFQTLELRHRRLRTEAAAALARLEEKAGLEALVELAREPVARLRVLAYAEELGALEQIEEQYQTALARGEAELAVWLAEPTQFGFPPGQLELFDSRVQYWPGFTEPVECFLFRFAYQFGDQTYGNVGIAGPVAHAFIADLSDLPPDDIYAAFAGWQAEHEELREWPVEQLSAARLGEVSRLARRLRDRGYEGVSPVLLGSFFGDSVLVAQAARDGAAGTTVVDADDVLWRARGVSRRPLGPSEVYCIYKGRRLLRSFNLVE